MEDQDNPADIESARKMFAGECDFVAGADVLERIPPHNLPEIAFAGRSNVGKSSLVNALTGRKALARTSITPGRTQQINFFDLAGRMNLVDMPGYGYAKVSKQKKAEWDVLIRGYLRGRSTLRCVYVLIDSRHGLKDVDQDIMDMLDEAGVAYRVVFTKVDRAEGLAKNIADTEAVLKKQTAAFPHVMLTSSYDGKGIAELRTQIYRTVTA
jgi:GTP-binding protein